MQVDSILELQQKLRQANYLATHDLATAVFLGLALNKPLLIEGPAGVGKTCLAKALAIALNADLIRLQCYEGLDETKAIYEWDYQKQLLFIQTQINKIDNWKTYQTRLFSMEFCIPRPIMQALLNDNHTILLIDEVDKTDEQFESYLLEAIEEYQVTIPEIGTIPANGKPFIILTSNDSRDFSDALKRRCIHTYIDFPDRETELQILKLHIPDIDHQFTHNIIGFVSLLRKLDLKKLPSIAETIEWAQTLIKLKISNFEVGLIEPTLGVLIKHKKDRELVVSKLEGLLKQ